MEDAPPTPMLRPHPWSQSLLGSNIVLCFPSSLQTTRNAADRRTAGEKKRWRSPQLLVCLPRLSPAGAMIQSPKPADMEYRPDKLDPIAPLRLALRGHYEIEREIGQGAFATVYLARDLKHERKVAVKVLNADPTSDTGELRFIREIRMLARLQHPNILPLHDSGHVEALLYYVMPYVSGETLRSRIDRERQLAIEDAVCIAQEAADALAYAHGQGI